MAALAALTGCAVTHVPLSDRYPGPRELPPDLAERFHYTAATPSGAEEALRRRANFTVRQVLLESSTGSEPIELEYYDTEGDARTPVVVLLPIFNGHLVVTRYFAKYFAQRGWAAVVVGVNRERMQTIDELGEALHATLADYRRALDWIEQQPELDSERIGLFGISFGGSDAVMLAALDPRVDALVAAMAGGDFPYMAMNTRYRPVARVIDEVVEENGLTESALERLLKEEIPFDPLTLAPYVDAQRALLVLARSDVIVPFEAQQRLWLTMGRPEALYLPTGHRTSVVYFPKLRESAYEFFARQFGMPDGVAHN